MASKDERGAADRLDVCVLQYLLSVSLLFDPECQSVLTVLSVCDRVEILAQRYYYCNVVV